jgi:hypothetical protein
MADYDALDEINQLMKEAQRLQNEAEEEANLLAQALEIGREAQQRANDMSISVTNELTVLGQDLYATRDNANDLQQIDSATRKAAAEVWHQFTSSQQEGNNHNYGELPYENRHISRFIQQDTSRFATVNLAPIEEMRKALTIKTPASERWKQEAESITLLTDVLKTLDQAEQAEEVTEPSQPVEYEQERVTVKKQQTQRS